MSYSGILHHCGEVWVTSPKPANSIKLKGPYTVEHLNEAKSVTPEQLPNSEPLLPPLKEELPVNFCCSSLINKPEASQPRCPSADK